MVCLSSLTVLLKSPIALIRIIVTPILYMTFCLSSAITIILQYAFGSRTDNLRSTSQQRYMDLLCEQEKKKLLDAWSASAISEVMFVSIEVSHRNNETSEISEIALSSWFMNHFRKIRTSLWIIRPEKLEDEEYNTHENPNSVSGTLQHIRVDEIPIHLTDQFSGFKKQSEKLYLIGYDINKTLDLMRHIWVLPQDVVVIDTEMVFQSQNRGVSRLPFEACIERIPQLREQSSFPINTAKKAHLGIQLLQHQIKCFRGAEVSSIRGI